jgi:hypothetical protein
MTGRSFGQVYVLNGFLPLRPWLPAGITSSEIYGQTVLYRLSCEQLVQAWMIVDSAGVDSFDPGILEKAGIDYRGQYQSVVSAKLPVGRIVDRKVRFRTLELLKPVKPTVERAELCRVRRAKALPADLAPLKR